MIGSLNPDSNPKFAQIYIHDTEFEIENRFKIFNNLNKDILLQLQNMVHELNPYVKSFKYALQLSKESTVPELRMIIRAEKQSDLRRYNVPTSSEIAVIIPGNNNTNVLPRDIVIQKSGGGLK